MKNRKTVHIMKYTVIVSAIALGALAFTGCEECHVCEYEDTQGDMVSNEFCSTDDGEIDSFYNTNEVAALNNGTTANCYQKGI